MRHFVNAALLTVALMIPVAATAQDHHDARTYHDNAHNDEHHWDNHEDRAYRMWAKENHRKYVDFARLKADDQQNYWRWRHDHSDVQLKINIP